MPAVPLADPAAERVGVLVRDAVRAVLGARLEALLVHGSAVTGGYLKGFSDFDFVVFLRGELSTTDSLAIQGRLGEADHHPFDYLQISRVIDLDRPPMGDGRRVLIDSAYSALHGQYPEGWPFLDTEALAASGRRVLDSLPVLLDRKRRHWAAATGARRILEVRYHMTDLKPVIRAMLAELGEPVVDVWTAPYPELVRRWAAHDPERAARFQVLLDALPAAPEREAEIGEEMLLLLESIAGLRR